MLFSFSSLLFCFLAVVSWVWFKFRFRFRVTVFWRENLCSLIHPPWNDHCAPCPQTSWWRKGCSPHPSAATERCSYFFFVFALFVFFPENLLLCSKPKLFPWRLTLYWRREQSVRTDFCFSCSALVSVSLCGAARSRWWTHERAVHVHALPVLVCVCQRSGSIIGAQPVIMGPLD